MRAFTGSNQMQAVSGGHTRTRSSSEQTRFLAGVFRSKQQELTEARSLGAAGRLYQQYNLFRRQLEVFPAKLVEKKKNRFSFSKKNQIRHRLSGPCC